MLTSYWGKIYKKDAKFINTKSLEVSLTVCVSDKKKVKIITLTNQPYTKSTKSPQQISLLGLRGQTPLFMAAASLGHSAELNAVRFLYTAFAVMLF